MSHLMQVKQQIQAIQATQKITNAIRLVSMSLYTKLDRQQAVLNNYTKHIRLLFSDLIRATPNWKNSLLFPEDLFDTHPLYIIIASTKGLCGSFNSSLFRYIEHALFVEEHQTPHFITIGPKAHKFIKEKNWGNIIYSYNDFNSNNFLTIANDLIEKIANAPVRYSSVVFYHPEAKSFFVHKPKKFTLIPVTLEPVETNKCFKDDHEEMQFIWEQSKDLVLDQVALCFLQTSIAHALFISLLTEHAARFLAMDSSTTNAEKYIERLTLYYNKMRQALITKEVAELSSGLQPY